MSNSVNIEFVPDMQRKLYRWSVADRQRRYADLFNLVCDRRTLDHAWRRLSRNRGSQTPGTDGVTRRKVEEQPGGVTIFIETIREELRTGTYIPEIVRQRLIPKPGKPGKFRPLGIPTLKDRLVQLALKLILEPIFEADFHPTSYGFRPGRSTHDALARIQRRLHPTCGGPSVTRFAIEGDIKGCFDAIDHHVLMERVRIRIQDRRVLRLILAFLKAGILAEGTVRHPVTGTPQGGVISPLLANIYLSAIDERYERWSGRPQESIGSSIKRRLRDRRNGRPTCFMVRYADDFVVLVEGDRNDAEAECQALAQFIAYELRMELSIEKTKITDVRDGFDFLGYQAMQTKARLSGAYVGNLFIPRAKLIDLRRKIKVVVRKTPTGVPLADLIKSLNPIVTGWRNYFQYATGASRDFSKLDWWLWQRIGRWLRKKHKGASWATIRRRFTSYLGTRSSWAEGSARLRPFAIGGTFRYLDRGTRIPNGWNADPDEWFPSGATQFWAASNTLATL